MTSKRSKPLEEPPAVSSSSEDEEASSGEEEEEEEEESSSSEEKEKAGRQPPKLSSPPPRTQSPKQVTVKKTEDSTRQQQSEESESETESASGSESDAGDLPTSPVKPIASKPMEETPTKKPRSKSSSVTPVTASKPTSSLKRVIESDRDAPVSKRAKKKEPEADGVVEKSEETKKFQRKWSEDDEIALLNGIIHFTAKKGIDFTEFFKDMNAFYDFIKKSMHFDFTLAQLKDKVWRLKKKFEGNVNRSKHGEDKTFSKAHDQKAFDLSKKIWGSEVTGRGVESSLKSNGKLKKLVSSSNAKNPRGRAALDTDTSKDKEGVDMMEVEVISGVKQRMSYGLSSMEDFVIKKGMDVLDGEKKAEMEKKWKNLHVVELELFLKRNELISEQAKLLLASYKGEED